nr:MAG TPA: hypothetical protein [Caudoviricetes sp.]
MRKRKNNLPLPCSSLLQTTTHGTTSKFYH